MIQLIEPVPGRLRNKSLDAALIVVVQRTVMLVQVSPFMMFSKDAGKSQHLDFSLQGIILMNTE